MVIPMEDWLHSGDAMSPDTRRELVGSGLMVLVQPVEGTAARGGRAGREGGGCLAHVGVRSRRGEGSLYLPCFCRKGEKVEGGRARNENVGWSGGRAKVRARVSTDGWWGSRCVVGMAAHAPAIGIDPTSRQHLVAPHVPR